jgi:hypothetical protein
MKSNVIEKVIVPEVLRKSVLYQYQHSLYRYEMIRRTYLWGHIWNLLFNGNEEAINSYNSYTKRLGDIAVYGDFLDGGRIAKEDNFIANHSDVLEKLIRYVLCGDGELELLVDKTILEEAIHVAKKDSIVTLNRVYSLPSPLSINRR